MSRSVSCYINCARVPSLFVAASKIKMSRQITLGRLALKYYKQSIPHRDTMMQWRKWKHLILFQLKIYLIAFYLQIFNSKLYSFQNCQKYRCSNFEYYSHDVFNQKREIRLGKSSFNVKRGGGGEWGGGGVPKRPAQSVSTTKTL